MKTNFARIQDHDDTALPETDSQRHDAGGPARPGRVVGIAYSRIRDSGPVGSWVVCVAHTTHSDGTIAVTYHFASREMAIQQEEGRPNALGVLISRLGPVCAPVPRRTFVSAVGDDEAISAIQERVIQDGHRWDV